MIKFTQHALVRMSQRGITKDMIELAVDYGRVVKDKIILGRKEIKKLIANNPSSKSKFLKIFDKKGLVVVFGKDNSVITVYKLQGGFRGRASCFIRR